MDQEKILIRAIIEMIGAPKEHIEKTLYGYIEKLKKDGLVILKENFAEAEQKEKLFSAFVEMDVQFKDVEELLAFCFDSMPSSVEILEPGELMFESRTLSNFLNDLQARLHQADMIVKYSRAEKELLDKNSVAVFRNFIKYLLKEGAKTPEELSAPMGVGAESLAPFLKLLTEKGIIKFDGNKYSVGNR